MSHDVFISYSSKDKPIADGVCATLEQNGLRCWIAPRDIIPGAEWSTSIIQGLAEARVFVLVLSHSANASGQVTREVERAVHNGLPIIPYRIEDVMPTDALEYFISTPHWLDAFTPPVERHAQSLAAAIKRLLHEPAVGEDETAASRPIPTPPPPPPSVTPGAAAKPVGLSAPVLVGGAIGVLVLGAIGFVALRPQTAVSTPTPAAAGMPAQAGAASDVSAFVGDWTVAKAAWAPGMSAGYTPVTLGELWAAVMNANRTTGVYHFDPTGAFENITEVDDTGTVTRQGDYLVFTSADGATAPVRLQLSSGPALGGQVGESGFVLTGNRRLPEGWIGAADLQAAGGPLMGVAGGWRSAGWPTTPTGVVPTGSLTIAPDGAYKLQLFGTSGGVFKASNGAWATSVRAPTGQDAQASGTYVFNGPDQVTMTSVTDTTVWRRK